MKGMKGGTYMVNIEQVPWEEHGPKKKSLITVSPFPSEGLLMVLANERERYGFAIDTFHDTFMGGADCS